MSLMPWVKIRSGFLRDEKIHFIIKKYGHDCIVFWTGLLTECRRGVLEMPEEVFAEICIMDIQRFEEIKKVFIKFELVTVCNDGKLTIKNWAKYQYSESYERVKAHRERSVTTRNAPETDKKQSVTVERDTEADTDTEEEKTETPPGLDMTVWSTWIEYRKQIRKQYKPVSIPAAMRKLASFGSNQAAVVEQSIANGWTGLFDLKDQGARGSTRRKTIEDYRAQGGTHDGGAIPGSAKRVA